MERDVLCACRPARSARSGAVFGVSGEGACLGWPSCGAAIPGGGVQPNRVMDFGPYWPGAECSSPLSPVLMTLSRWTRRSSAIGSSKPDPMAVNTWLERDRVRFVDPIALDLQASGTVLPLHAEHPTEAGDNSHDLNTAPKAHTFRLVHARSRGHDNLASLAYGRSSRFLRTRTCLWAPPLAVWFWAPSRLNRAP